MKLGSVTKLDTTSKTLSKKIDHDVMLESYDVVVIFLIYGQFRAIRNPDSGHIVYKTYIFIKNNFLSYKTWKHN